MIKDEEIKQLAMECLNSGNPYVRQAQTYKFEDDVLYLWHNELYRKETLDDMYLDTACKDIKRGYDERLTGYYDKWYRYNHADDGFAYDRGVIRALGEKDCPKEVTIISCQFLL